MSYNSDPCEGFDCANGGECFAMDHSAAVCYCRGPWTGRHCDSKIICPTNP